MPHHMETVSKILETLEKIYNFAHVTLIGKFGFCITSLKNFKLVQLAKRFLRKNTT